ncbi:hypothetical protein AMTRI_Chr12g272690 [Amborella trichopoda]
MEQKRKGMSKLARCLKACSPIRALCKARDFYVRSMNECAGVADFTMIMGGPTGGVTMLPRSYSTASTRSQEDLRELIRAASQKREKGKINPSPVILTPTAARVAKSRSVNIGTIDEEQPCYFNGSFNKKNEGGEFIPRSRSCAVAQGRMGF